MAAAKGWDVDRLGDLLAPCRLGRPLEVRARVGSTSDLARVAGRSGAPDGTLFVADEQTEGRGRRGRRWESPPGGGIYASLLLRPGGGVDRDYAAAAQLAVGVALAESLSPYLPEPAELLWPNDCYCRGQKIAGVLVEAETTGAEVEFLVCGIGVNVNQPADAFGPELRGQAASVRSLSGTEVDRETILAALLFGLESWDAVARAGELRPLCRRWEELSPASRGAEVRVEVVDGLLQGVADGLSDAGALRVLADGIVHEVSVGELVRVRRRR